MHEIIEMVEQNARKRSLRRAAEALAPGICRRRALARLATLAELPDEAREDALAALIEEVMDGARGGWLAPDAVAERMTLAELVEAVKQHADAAALGEICDRLRDTLQEGRSNG